MGPFEDHLTAPRGLGRLDDADGTGAAGGAPCGDLVRIDLAVDGDRIARAAFEADGCGAASAAGSAVVELVAGGPFLAAARVGAREIAAELGGLSPGKFHAAALAADALHRALGQAAAAGPMPRRATRRTLVAMSGGVDSAVAAQLAADARRRRRRRHARAVGGPRRRHDAQLLLERGGGHARARSRTGWGSRT